jgi:phytoene dehydrogenase-like protein
MDDMLMAQTSLTSDLGLERYGYEPVPLTAPYGWIGEDGETLLLFRDFERTLQDIRRHSVADAKTYAEIKPTLDLVMDLTEDLVSTRPKEISRKALLRTAVKLATPAHRRGVDRAGRRERLPTALLSEWVSGKVRLARLMKFGACRRTSSRATASRRCWCRRRC